MRFQRVLEVIERDQLVENAATVGTLFLRELEGLQAKRPDLLSNARGRGLLLAIDLPDGTTRNAVMQACMNQGLFSLTCGDRSLRFRPTLTFSEADVGEAVEKLDKALGSLS